MSDLLECFNAIAFSVSVTEGYMILSTSEEGTEDGPRVLLYICMEEICVQRIVIFFQFIGHVG